VKPGGWGTLYTACYRPETLGVELRWPNTSWSQSIGAFAPGAVTAAYS
jgi:hypothetical protein